MWWTNFGQTHFSIVIVLLGISNKPLLNTLFDGKKKKLSREKLVWFVIKPKLLSETEDFFLIQLI